MDTCHNTRHRIVPQLLLYTTGKLFQAPRIEKSCGRIESAASNYQTTIIRLGSANQQLGWMKSNLVDPPRSSHHSKIQTARHRCPCVLYDAGALARKCDSKRMTRHKYEQSSRMKQCRCRRDCPRPHCVPCLSLHQISGFHHRNFPSQCQRSPESEHGSVCEFEL